MKKVISTLFFFFILQSTWAVNSFVSSDVVFLDVNSTSSRTLFTAESSTKDIDSDSIGFYSSYNNNDYYNKTKNQFSPTTTLLTCASVGVANPVVCLGDPISFYEIDISSISWSWTGPNGFVSTVQNPVIPSANLAASGTYTVEVSSATNTVTCDVIVVVEDLFVNLIIDSNITCVGASDGAISATVSGGSSPLSYYWSANAGGQAGSAITGLAAGNYSLTVTSSNGCERVASINIDNPQPIPVNIFHTGTSICEGDSTELYTSITGVNYEWTDPLGALYSTNSSIKVYGVVGASGIYTLKITDSHGCSSSDSVNIAVVPGPPGPIISGGANICEGDTIILNSNATCHHVFWESPLGIFANWANDLLIDSSSAAYGDADWVLVCSDTLTGCSATSNIISIKINEKPNVIVANNGPVCINETVQLTASSWLGATYNWFSDASLTNPIKFGQVVLIDSISMDSTFYVEVTDTNTCTASAATSVAVIFPMAPPNVSSDVYICEGESFMLTSDFALGYDWKGPGGFASTQWNPTILNATTAQTGTYSLSVIGINGCWTLDTTVQVRVDTLPLSPTIEPFITICFGDTLFLNADSTSNHCDSVYWLGPNGVQSPGRNLVITKGDANYLSGSWQQYCLDTLTNCASVSNFSVVLISPRPDTPTVWNNGPICMGGSVSLSTGLAPNATNYTWYANSTLTTIAKTGQNVLVDSIITDTIFYLVITNSSGCRSQAMPSFVSVLPQSAAPLILADTQYCVGETINFSTNLASQYYWSATNGFVATSQSPVINSATVLDSGAYSLIIRDANACLSLVSTIHIKVDALPPTPVISSNSPICEGDTLYLNSSSICHQAQWIGPLGSTALGTPGGGNPLWTYSPSTIIEAGTASYQNSNWFMICIDTLTGCEAISNTISVIISPNPVFYFISNNTIICYNDTIPLTATTASVANISWYTDASLTTAIGSGTSITTPKLTTTTTFYVLATDPNTACTTLDSIVIFVQPLTRPVIVANTNLCAGDSLLLSTNNALFYQWSGPNGFSSTSQNPIIFPTTILDQGVYSLSIIDSNYCSSDNAILNIQINATPTMPTLINSSPSCTGGNLTLTASPPSAGVSYEWFSPLGISIGTSNPLIMNNLTLSDTGYYYLVASNGICSLTSATTLVSIYADTSAAPNAGLDFALCGFDTASLNAVMPTIGTTGRWTTNSGALIFSPTLPTTFVANLQVGENIFYWTLSNATCVDFAMDSIIIRLDTPSNNIANAGLNQSLCGDSTTVLTANTPIGLEVGTWTQSAAQAANGLVIIDTLNPTTAIEGMKVGTTYSLVWTINNGACQTTTDTVLISLARADNLANAGGDITVCDDGIIQLAATNPSVGTGRWTSNSSAIIINPNQHNTIITNLNIGETRFIWTLSNGACTNYASDTIYIIVGEVSPIANVDSFSLLANSSSLVIDVLPNDDLTDSWNIYIHTPMNIGQMTNLNNGEFELNLQGVATNQQFIYELCNAVCPLMCDTALVIIDLQQRLDCDVPNIFTPNGDGINDYFEIPCLNASQNTWLSIFNRWGDQVYETDSYQNQWDGTMRGKPLPDGTYYYIVRIETGEQLQGFVELRR